MSEVIPLSLYVHYPWCLQKCPYCDFNSHAIKKDPISEQNYIDALLKDLDHSLAHISGLNFDRPIKSIFFGGGTPSLISGSGIDQFLTKLSQKISISSEAEITLEANPGTVDSDHFYQYIKSGINRLSIGVQSFRDQQLKELGRIHSSNEASSAFTIARDAGFKNINIDLMFGLPKDTLEGSLFDLEQAISLKPEHISWYQLTMEPNTLFYRQPPVLPGDDLLWEMHDAGQILLAQAGFQQYEISAYATKNRQCQHNLNYWTFGDYIGIGAGAHSKITDLELHEIERFSKPRHPKQYLNKPDQFIERRILNQEDLILEFMMNALRLNGGFLIEEFESRTGLQASKLDQKMKQALKKELAEEKENRIIPTEKGRLFLNDLLEIFS
ncbi:MAG: radical SAM family heme chaperone HemW [Gammaproteobacteria bacterium]